MARDVQRNRERRTRGGALKQLPWRNYRNPYKPIEVLQEEQIERIHDASLRILEVNGIEFLDAGARDRLKAAGADVESGGLRVRFDREMVLVADHKNPETGVHEIRGVGRLSKLRGTNEAEFALLVSDRFQGRGLGTKLLDRLLQIGRAENIARISGHILAENTEMKRVCEKLGFRLDRRIDDSVIEAVIEL